MSVTEKLKALIEKYDGVITTKLAEENSIHREYLRGLVRDGDLERVAHGIYITPEVWEDQMMIIQLRKNKMIYSHETALYLHDLTDRDPVQYVVTVPHGYNPTRLKEEGLNVHTVKRELFELGVCYKETTFGNKVKAYDMERTICDILRDRNNQDPSIVSDAIKRYLSSKDKDLNQIMKYARLLRVENVLRPYFEVML
ncbi:type IV toxin-antitoxin system AbiEi family antitoxin domain-containing protein [Serpentinicella sp. ANB-PHB4]|uniref:type IV toxin-antitoxin system AbiEi family antitoxin domain-containing protein n=1 Tax=Serpentinicella sp. ANB-PHB4 TaxID=3074076 RepID=UPI0028577A61|nr:type IV toxin-antitoxin system AbiEi family antitoxin domain-containing protein [Serpentinicella sp. ANB-PHB4]MDR5659952.1 type IV toxin-antitoxin system AbiEi family antitoxin domain-containing protein [Serpentinicella sp. ANB-PHB4]